MAGKIINLNAFWNGNQFERISLLNTLIFIHEKKCEIERKPSELNTPQKLAKNSIVPPPPPQKKPVEKRTAPCANEEDFEVVIHKITFEDDSDEEAFMIHKQKKCNTPSLNLNEK